MESSVFLIGFSTFLLGFIIGAAVIYFLQKKNEDVSVIKNKLSELQTKINERDGSFKTILDDIKNEKNKFSEIAQELQITLIRGSSKKQGTWGEKVIKDLLFRIGFEEGVQFTEQKQFSGDENEKKSPDVIINLGDNRHVVIDSKVSLKAWDEYANATDETIRQAALKEHLKSLKTHIKSLSSKNYTNLYKINTVDAVLMFVPIEPSIAGLGKDGYEITEYALENKVSIVGPSMLLYILKTVDQFWKVQKRYNNFSEVIRLANTLYDKGVAIYKSAEAAIDSLDSSRKKLEDVKDKMQDGRDSFLGKLNKMEKLGGLSPKEKIAEDVVEKIEEEKKKIEVKH
jgi:DNA recombination protein RmuC